MRKHETQSNRESCVFHFSHFELCFALHSRVLSTFLQHLVQFPTIIYRAFAWLVGPCFPPSPNPSPQGLSSPCSSSPPPPTPLWSTDQLPSKTIFGDPNKIIYLIIRFGVSVQLSIFTNIPLTSLLGESKYKQRVLS